MARSGARVVGLRCAKCAAEYRSDEAPYTCPSCGTEGILDVLYDYDEIGRRVTRRTFADSGEESLWRYLPLLPVESDETIPRLRTGRTPLYEASGLLGIRRLYIKDDSLNPTASLGNAGCSLAGFAAAEGAPCYIFVPADAPRPKVAQLLIYGATVFAVDGSYDDAFDLAIRAIDRFGWYNRCCAVNPYLVEGKKTVAFEIAEDLDFQAPDKVFVPVGDGCIMSGVYKGFAEFARLGLTDRVPSLVGVQAEGADPVRTAFEGGCEMVPCRARTCADSIAVGHPRNWRKAVKGVRASGGSMMAVSDDEILSAIADLSRATGVFGEPAGVTAFAGLQKAVRDGAVGDDETIVVLMTGSGLKDTESAMRAAGKPVPVGTDVGDVERYLSTG
jgi:threonine synthase